MAGSACGYPVIEPHPYLDGVYPRAYAHRGWHIDDLDGCENTMAAFRRAVEEGFGYLELDVHASADGVAVVHHDSWLDRTTERSGPIAARTAAEITTIRVRGREPIPTLEQVLVELPGARVTVELKSDAAVESVLTVLELTGSWHRVCVGAVADRWLSRARALAGARLFTSMAMCAVVALRSRAWLDALPGPLSRLPGMAGCGDLAQLPRRFGGITVVDEALVRTAHAAGHEVHVWTVDEPCEMADLLDLGVDGLLSDRPDLLRETLRERGAWTAA